eukprot:691355-Prorocentrum_minimum.AAC.1
MGLLHGSSKLTTLTQADRLYKAKLFRFLVADRSLTFEATPTSLSTTGKENLDRKTTLLGSHPKKKIHGNVAARSDTHNTVGRFPLPPYDILTCNTHLDDVEYSVRRRQAHYALGIQEISRAFWRGT